MGSTDRSSALCQVGHCVFDLPSYAPAVTHDPPKAAPPPKEPRVPLDPSQPTTTVQIRLADGTR